MTTTIVDRLDLHGKITVRHGKEIEEIIEDYKSDALKEYKQFVSNILDGIDQADLETGNTEGGTKAIRLALSMRVI